MLRRKINALIQKGRRPRVYGQRVSQNGQIAAPKNGYSIELLHDRRKRLVLDVAIDKIGKRPVKTSLIISHKGKLVGNIVIERDKQDPGIAKLKSAKLSKEYCGEDFGRLLAEKARELIHSQTFREAVATIPITESELITELKKHGFKQIKKSGANVTLEYKDSFLAKIYGDVNPKNTYGSN